MKAGTGEVTTNEIYNSDSSDEEEYDEHNIFRKNKPSLNSNVTITSQKIQNPQIIINFDSKFQLEKINTNIKIYILILASLCTCLDGFILIFLGYNSSILTKEWSWQDNSVAFLEIIYHLVSAFGGLLSIFTTNITTKNGLNYGVVFSLIAFFLSIPLLNIQNFPLYVIIFFVICLSNGHLQNITTTLIIKKYPSHNRAAVYVFAYFFTQFGKFLFACLIYKFNEIIIKGDLTFTVIPILLIIILQIIINLILLKFMKKRGALKNKKSGNLNEILQNSQNLNVVEHQQINLGNLIHIELPQMENKSFLQSEVNFYTIFWSPFTELFSNYRYHIFNLIFLNMSLGIQFFSMINVFPILKNKTFVILVDEIFVSKAYHTIFLLFLPFLFLFKTMTRKFLLIITFSSSLLLNSLILLNIFSSSLMIHFFRFIWNVCFITINLYCAESVAKKLRGVNTAIMYFIFKTSCVIEILTIDKLINVSIYLPIFFNIIILIGDMLLVNKLQIETHMKSVEDIEKETISLNVNLNEG